MYLIRKPVCCMLLLMEVIVWMNPSLTEGSPLCCYTVLSNGSVYYTQNMTVNFDYAWNDGAIPLSDEQGNTNGAIVLNSGTNWILLNKLYFNVNFMSTAPESGMKIPIPCTEPCDSGKADVDVPDSKAASVASVAFISIAFVILTIIIWK